MSSEDKRNPADKKYSFVSNALFHWKELFVREPAVAACTIALTAVGTALPLMNARLPKMVLKGLEEHWDFPVFYPGGRLPGCLS